MRFSTAFSRLKVRVNCVGSVGAASGIFAIGSKKMGWSVRILI
jgi:hypothetical protein